MNTSAAAPGTFTYSGPPTAPRFDHGWLQTRHSFSFADYFDPQNLRWGALRVFNDDIGRAGEGVRDASASRHGDP